MSANRLCAAICSLWLLLSSGGAAQNIEEAASLEITTIPPGALVVLDRNVLGQAPLRIYPLRPGTHLLRISAGEDYRPYIHEFEVTPGQSMRLDVRLESSTRLKLEEGRSLVRQRRFREALPLLEGAVEGLPRMPEAWWWIGQIRLVWGETDRALEAFRAYADFAPDRPDLYLFLGLLHDLEDRPAEAVTAYKLALLKTPGLENALDGLSDDPTWKEVEALGRPSDARGRLRRAQLLSLKGRMDQALAELREAVSQVYGDWRERVPRAEFPPVR
ncbi:MAG: tetratricopeptide repeat protein [Candidatus Eremiobacterota bacterium]